MEKIEVHIDYEYLPIGQFSNILNAINGVYRGVVDLLIYQRFQYLSSTNIIYYPLPLCLDECQTGNSINFNINFDEKFFPSVAINEGTADVHLPKWTLALFLTGSILTYGLDNYKTIVEISKIKLENQKIQLELDKMRNNRNPAVQKIKASEATFKSEIHKENIYSITINNTIVKEKREPLSSESDHD